MAKKQDRKRTKKNKKTKSKGKNRTPRIFKDSKGYYIKLKGRKIRLQAELSKKALMDLVKKSFQRKVNERQPKVNPQLITPLNDALKGFSTAQNATQLQLNNLNQDLKEKERRLKVEKDDKMKNELKKDINDKQKEISKLQRSVLRLEGMTNNLLLLKQGTQNQPNQTPQKTPSQMAPRSGNTPNIQQIKTPINATPRYVAILNKINDIIKDANVNWDKMSVDEQENITKKLSKRLNALSIPVAIFPSTFVQDQVENIKKTKEDEKKKDIELNSKKAKDLFKDIFKTGKKNDKNKTERNEQYKKLAESYNISIDKRKTDISSSMIIELIDAIVDKEFNEKSDAEKEQLKNEILAKIYQNSKNESTDDILGNFASDVIDVINTIFDGDIFYDDSEEDINDESSFLVDSKNLSKEEISDEEQMLSDANLSEKSKKMFENIQNLTPEGQNLLNQAMINQGIKDKGEQNTYSRSNIIKFIDRAKQSANFKKLMSDLDKFTTNKLKQELLKRENAEKKLELLSSDDNEDEQEKPPEDEQEKPPNAGKNGVDGDGMYDYEINNAMKGFGKYGYKGTFGIDEFSKIRQLVRTGENYVSFIMNTEPSFSKKTGHWVAVYISPSSLEYFDSFAEEPPKRFNREILEIIDKMAPDVYLKYKVNKVKRQSVSSANCGLFAMKFLYDRIVLGKDYKFCTGYSEVEKSEREIKKWGREFKLI